MFKGYSHRCKIDNMIPCLFLKSVEPSEKLVIYFHGNAEDIGRNISFLSIIQRELKCHAMAVEYPGYGVYKGSPTEEAIQNDADMVLEFVRHQLGFSSGDIILVGRSIGSGPATYLASRVKTIGALGLVSPYTSIKGVVGDTLGTLGKIGKHLIKERFPNVE